MANDRGNLMYNVSNTPRLNEATAIHSGSNIWLFFGSLLDGNYFMMDDYGFVDIVDEDPRKDLDESLMEEWQQKHFIRDLRSQQRTLFHEQLVSYLQKNVEDKNYDVTGGISSVELEQYKNIFKVVD